MAKAFIEKIILRMFYSLKINEFYTRKSNHDSAQILAYHEVGRSNFDKHIRYLKSNGYSIISMDEFTEYLYSNNAIPPKTIIITFDDGWKSNYSEVYPVACKYKIPVIIYIVSQVYVTGLKPWFFVMAELKSSGVTNIPDETYLVSLDYKKRNKVVQKIKTRYKDQLHRSHALSVNEIMEMRDSGFVSFGSHTSTHPDFNRIPMEEAKKESCKSKTDLEMLLNHSIDHFAYPKGNFSPQHFDIIKSAGYKTAVTTIPGYNNHQKGTNPFELKRIFMSGKDDVSVLSAKLSGIWYNLHKQKIHYS